MVVITFTRNTFWKPSTRNGHGLANRCWLFALWLHVQIGSGALRPDRCNRRGKRCNRSRLRCVTFTACRSHGRVQLVLVLLRLSSFTRGSQPSGEFSSLNGNTFGWTDRLEFILTSVLRRLWCSRMMKRRWSRFWGQIFFWGSVERMFYICKSKVPIFSSRFRCPVGAAIHTGRTVLACQHAAQGLWLQRVKIVHRFAILLLLNWILFVVGLTSLLIRGHYLGSSLGRAVGLSHHLASGNLGADAGVGRLRVSSRRWRSVSSTLIRIWLNNGLCNSFIIVRLKIERSKVIRIWFVYIRLLQVNLRNVGRVVNSIGVKQG